MCQEGAISPRSSDFDSTAIQTRASAKRWHGGLPMRLRQPRDVRDCPPATSGQEHVGHGGAARHNAEGSQLRLMVWVRQPAGRDQPYASVDTRTMRETGPNMRSCQIMLLQSVIMSTESRQCRNRMTRYVGIPSYESAADPRSNVLYVKASDLKDRNEKLETCLL